MIALPTVQYAYFFSISTIGILLDGPGVISQTTNIITFSLKSSGYLDTDEWVITGKKFYMCMDCLQYANKTWETSIFKPVGVPRDTIPQFIEEEMREHVANHMQFGEWYRNKHRRQDEVNHA